MPRKRLPPGPPKDHPDKGRRSPGAPELNIDREEILKLAKCGWQTKRIAEFFGCHTDSIYRRVSSVELNAARHERGGKLLEAVYIRAMGGRIERKREDGSIEISYLKSSDRALSTALKYYVGLPPQQIDLNPDPERPAHVAATVDKEVLKDAVKNAISELDAEY